MPQSKIFYQRHLPHYQPQGALFHIVFRLTDSLPAEAVERLRQEREQLVQDTSKLADLDERQRKMIQIRLSCFERFDELLDGMSDGPKWLEQSEVAEIIKEAIHYRDKSVYDLFAYCIMPNHVHIVFENVGRPGWSTYKGQTKSSPYGVTKILESLKWFTAIKANQELKRSGQFWHHESYDHVIRDENELERTIWYVLNNPVKAGLVQKWAEWKWSYVKPEFVKFYSV